MPLRVDPQTEQLQRLESYAQYSKLQQTGNAPTPAYIAIEQALALAYIAREMLGSSPRYGDMWTSTLN